MTSSSAKADYPCLIEIRRVEVPFIGTRRILHVNLSVGSGASAADTRVWSLCRHNCRHVCSNLRFCERPPTTPTSSMNFNFSFFSVAFLRSRCTCVEKISCIPAPERIAEWTSKSIGGALGAKAANLL